MTTICFINQKGGCGKTSSCLHSAGAFAALGQSVLLVDIDPQGSLGQGFFGPAAVESLASSQTVAALFDDDAFLSDPQHIIRPTGFEGIMIAPTNHHLAAFNQPSPEKTGMRQFVVRDFLEGLSGFDLVLIDCPPNLYACSWAAMIAADYVVIPVPPEDFGIHGLPAVHQAIDQARTLNPGLRRLGHLVTRCDRRLVVHRNYEQTLRTAYRRMVLETVIPEANAFKIAVTARKPVEFFDPQSRAAELTRQLAQEILHRIADRTARRRAA